MGQITSKYRKNSTHSHSTTQTQTPQITTDKKVSVPRIDENVIKKQRENSLNQKLKQFGQMSLTKMHLVVDDLDLNRDLIVAYLCSVGLNCDGASNGEEALEFFMMKDKTYYDIVWIDITMPIMDGYELTQKLRSNGYTGVIIGITGNVSKESIDQCYNCGMDYVCAKPLLKYDLLSLKWFDCYPGVKDIVEEMHDIHSDDE